MDGSLLYGDGCVLPPWFLDTEIQAVIIAGLTCVGAWVILQWVLQKFCTVFQLMFTVLWPFFAVIAIMLLMPSWRKNLAEVYLPRHVRALKLWTARLASSFNASYN